jgi:hypothetical protein
MEKTHNTHMATGACTKTIQRATEVFRQWCAHVEDSRPRLSAAGGRRNVTVMTDITFEKQKGKPASAPSRPVSRGQMYLTACEEVRNTEGKRMIVPWGFSSLARIRNKYIHSSAGPDGSPRCPGNTRTTSS